MPITTVSLNNKAKLFTQRLFTAAIILLCLNSCSKKDNSIPQTSPILPSGPITANKIAKIWKNGIATSITDGSKNAQANSVYVVGNDIYVAGYESNGTNKVAKVWKNGIATSLTDGSGNSEGLSICVSGSDVYVAGSEYDSRAGGTKAVLWKNGVATYFTDGQWLATANSVYVNGNDVYVAGSFMKVTGSTGTPVAVLWKNGVATTFPDYSTAATSVYVYNNDVYVSSYESGNNGHAKLWTNGVPVTIGDDVQSSAVQSVFVSAGNVYLCGAVAKATAPITSPMATLWKNNKITFLTDGTTLALANSVNVTNNDVYVAGYQYSGTTTTVTSQGSNSVEGRNIAKLWKNGIATSLTDGTKAAAANSVFVSGGDVYVAGFEAVSK